MLLDVIDILTILTMKPITDIRGLDVGIIPLRRESRLQIAATVKSIRTNAEQALHDSSRCDAHIIAEVTICLLKCLVIVTDLAEVTRTGASAHFIEQIAVKQFVAHLTTSGNKIGQCHIGHLFMSHVIGTPGVGHPVGRADGKQILTWN